MNDTTPPHKPDRYARQSILPDFANADAPERLATATAVIVGAGALGSVSADLLARAGVGRIRIIDRDIVEHHNLHRQTLYTNDDADRGTPKAAAAEARLQAVNPDITIEGTAADIDGANAEATLNLDADDQKPTVIIDGTDNFETRFILNDAAVKHGVPYIYAGAVGTRGILMTVLPKGHPDAPWADAAGPCLRCILDEPPAAGTFDTCDTAGVLGPVSAATACFQATEALKIILGRFDLLRRHTLSFDPWNTVFARTDAGPSSIDPECACCAQRRFSHLRAHTAGESGAQRLCGRNAVRLSGARKCDLVAVGARLRTQNAVREAPGMLRVDLPEEGIDLTIFQDGRAIVRGTEDPARARSLYARYIGS